MDMDFTIEQRDEKTLKGRLKAYPFLRMELSEKFAGHKNLETALCHLTESALKDRIALLYHHYVNGSLSASGSDPYQTAEIFSPAPAWQQAAESRPRRSNPQYPGDG